jgi:hypothetical protein
MMQILDCAQESMELELALLDRSALVLEDPAEPEQRNGRRVRVDLDGALGCMRMRVDVQFE